MQRFSNGQSRAVNFELTMYIYSLCLSTLLPRPRMGASVEPPPPTFFWIGMSVSLLYLQVGEASIIFSRSLAQGVENFNTPASGP